MNKDRDMTKGVIWKNMLSFFLPVAAGALFQQLYNAVDAIIVGKFVGTQALAAVGGSASALTGLVVGIFLALGSGSAVIVAQFYGARKDGELLRATGTAVAFCIVCGLTLTAISEPLTKSFLLWMKTPADTIESSATYLHIYFLSISIMLFNNVGSGILRAVGDSRNPFIFMLISCLCNIVLDLLFVCAFKWEVAGVAWATVLSQVLNTILILVVLLRTKAPYRLELSCIRIDFSILKRMMYIGVPAAIQAAMYVLSNMLLQSSVNMLGTATVAGWALSGKLDGIYSAVSGAVCTTSTTFAGQNWGAGEKERIKKGYWEAAKLFMPLTLVILALLYFFGPQMLTLFTDDLMVQALAFRVLCWFLAPFILWTMLEISSGTLRGCGVVKIPTAITGLGICGFRVLWVLTVYKKFPTLDVICMCYAISYTLATIGNNAYYFIWKKKNL